MDPMEQDSTWPLASQENFDGHGSTTATKVPKRRWSTQEDSLLIELVKQYGVHNWSRIAEKIDGRKANRCRERWINNLDPNLKQPDVPWSEEEERSLANCHKKFGAKWSLIANMIPGRSENAIKNRWNTNVRKLERKMNPSTSDDHESSKRKLKRSKISNLQDTVIPVPVLTPTPDPSCSTSRFVGYDIHYVQNQLMSSVSAPSLGEPTARVGWFDAQELPENLFEGFDADEIYGKLLNMDEGEGSESTISTCSMEEPVGKEWEFHAKDQPGGWFDAQELPENLFEDFDLGEIYEELLNMVEGEGSVSTISTSGMEETIGKEGEFHVEDQLESLSDGYEADDIYHQLVIMNEFAFLASLPSLDVPNTEASEKQKQTIF